MSEAVLRPARVALVGNPNTGKTALFNALTGSRQKVANYAGVTVERKEGHVVTAAGRSLSILDLPGTYSLRARSPDEMVTRDAVLGKLAGEHPPDVVVAVADATNLRLVLRLILELKAVGRPMVLALNMYDIAQRQGLRIDIAGLQRELGCPIVTTVATRKRGIVELTAQVDELISSGALSTDNVWHEPSAAELRGAHGEAQRILKAYVRPPERPDTFTGKVDNVLLHPVAGLAILLAVLFLMFQAVFTWAAPIEDLVDAGFAAFGAFVGQALPDGLLKSFITQGLIAGVGGVLVFLPRILTLFFFIILLEDFGYMARAAFLLDRLMGAAGLHGRSVIPLLSSVACAIPGIMSTRVIDNKRDRLTTILVARLITCSARIPVYARSSRLHPERTVWGFASLQGLVCSGSTRPASVDPGGGAGDPADLLARRGRAVLMGCRPTRPRQSRRAAQPVAAGRDLREPGRAEHLPADGDHLVPLDLPRSAGRGDGPGDQLQPGRPAGPPAGAAARPHRVQLADDRGADPRLRGARDRGGGAGHRLFDRRRRQPRRRAGQPAGQPLVAGHRPVVPGLVHLPRSALRRCVVESDQLWRYLSSCSCRPALAYLARSWCSAGRWFWGGEACRPSGVDRSFSVSFNGAINQLV